MREDPEGVTDEGRGGGEGVAKGDQVEEATVGQGSCLLAVGPPTSSDWVVWLDALRPRRSCKSQ